MKAHRNTCAVCSQPIGVAFLMCATHWHLVPRGLATSVYRTFGAMTRKGATPQEQLQRIVAYRAARDAAVAHVKAHIDHPQGARP